MSIENPYNDLKKGNELLKKRLKKKQNNENPLGLILWVGFMLLMLFLLFANNL